MGFILHKSSPSNEKKGEPPRRNSFIVGPKVEFIVPHGLYLRGSKFVGYDSWDLRRRCQVIEPDGYQCAHEARNGCFTCQDHSRHESAMIKLLGTPAVHWEPVWKKQLRAQAKAMGIKYADPDWAPAKKSNHKIRFTQEELRLFKARQEGPPITETNIKFALAQGGLMLPVSDQRLSELIRPTLEVTSDLLLARQAKKSLEGQPELHRRKAKGARYHNDPVWEERHLANAEQAQVELNQATQRLWDLEIAATETSKVNLVAINCSFEIPMEILTMDDPFLTHKSEEGGTSTPRPRSKSANRGHGHRRKEKSRGHRRHKQYPRKTGADQALQRALNRVFQECQVLAQSRTEVPKTQNQTLSRVTGKGFSLRTKVQPKGSVSTKKKGGFVLKTTATSTDRSDSIVIPV